ncbi:MULTISPECIES: hypothetical protein [Candidatus Fukatsuia]|uniref:hypothetical protein n=1 Tax=Candidatus Fukatsuia TaxID=1927833 RepID=UPI0013C4AF9D|nr:hypothetical protein [Candidatus Fukatsuia symbiotica]
MVKGFIDERLSVHPSAEIISGKLCINTRGRTSLGKRAEIRLPENVYLLDCDSP